MSRLLPSRECCIVMMRLFSASSRYSTKPNPRDLQEPHHSTGSLRHCAPPAAGRSRAVAADAYVTLQPQRAPPRTWPLAGAGPARGKHNSTRQLPAARARNPPPRGRSRARAHGATYRCLEERNAPPPPPGEVQRARGLPGTGSGAATCTAALRRRAMPRPRGAAPSAGISRSGRLGSRRCRRGAGARSGAPATRGLITCHPART